MHQPWKTFKRWLRQRNQWSLKTFGPGARAEGICKHIEKELAEIRQNPGDLYEWIDVVLLGLDGAFRAGFDEDDVLTALLHKHDRNVLRQWPKPGAQDQPIEHVKKTRVKLANKPSQLDCLRES